MSVGLSSVADIARHERLAETAYGNMYDARPPQAKDCHDDARFHFTRAIEAAERAGRADEVARLTRRRDHVTAVYNSQFRHVG